MMFNDEEKRLNFFHFINWVNEFLKLPLRILELLFCWWLNHSQRWKNNYHAREYFALWPNFKLQVSFALLEADVFYYSDFQVTVLAETQSAMMTAKTSSLAMKIWKVAEGAKPSPLALTFVPDKNSPVAEGKFYFRYDLVRIIL